MTNKLENSGTLDNPITSESYSARLNQKWKRRAVYRGFSSMLISFISFYMYTKTDSSFLLIFTFIFALFSIIPLCLVYVFFKPIRIDANFVTFQFFKKQHISVNDLECVESNKIFGRLTLIGAAENRILIPWQLMDDAKAVCDQFILRGIRLNYCV